MSELIILNQLSDLRDLRELYNENYKENPVGFHVLDNFIRWFERDLQLKHVNVYTFSEQWRQSGLYLIVDRYALFINSLIPNDVEIGKALHLLDWSRGYKITALPEAHHGVVSTVLKSLKINWRDVRLHMYRLKRAKALEFKIDCPLEFELRALDQEAAAVINSHWYSQQAGSLYFFERLIQHNLSVGVYRRDTQELIAWCTRCQNGFLGSLHVKETYRRCGLAELIIQYFSRKLVEEFQHEDVHTAIYIHNEVSNRLFSKIGFKVICDVFHMVSFTVPIGEEWPFD